jgi:glutathione synthase/RimK-type ligase-like ATP-grasp enzyme
MVYTLIPIDYRDKRGEDMAKELSGPIGILDEHPEWSRRLLDELDRRGLPWEKIDHASHAFDPRDRRARHSVIVNRTSPSSHTRGHKNVLFYAEALLSHYESLGIPVVNPVAAYRFEKSKALQLGLFERVGARYPRALVVNHPAQALAAVDRLQLPVVVKPNVGGSGAGIVRVDSKAELESALDRLDFGPDGTALVQEYVESAEGAIVRVEVLGGQYLYAIRIVRDAQAGFNLCPADICQVPSAGVAPGAGPGACPATAPVGLTVSRFEAPPEAIDTVIRLARAASIDVGGVEYLVSKADGRIYYYDVNATSNFVANAEAVVGFDPTARFADYIVRRALERRAPAAAA